jgi:hypothetical protein
MTAVSDVDTPTVAVDLGIMEGNIRRVQAHLAKHGTGNRSHSYGVVCNMVDEPYGVRAAAVEVVWPVAARGRVR